MSLRFDLQLGHRVLAPESASRVSKAAFFYLGTLVFEQFFSINRTKICPK